MAFKKKEKTEEVKKEVVKKEAPEVIAVVSDIPDKKQRWNR